MRFCGPHWAGLREQIASRGLADLVAPSGEQLVRNLAIEDVRGPSIATFDPLMFAHMAILDQAMALSLDLFMPNPDGSERCPICHSQARHDRECVSPSCTAFGTGFDKWMERGADAALAERDRLLAEARPQA